MFSTQSTLDTNYLYVIYKQHPDKYYLCHLQSNDTNNTLTNNIYFTYSKIPTRASHWHSNSCYIMLKQFTHCDYFRVLIATSNMCILVMQKHFSFYR